MKRSWITYILAFVGVLLLVALAWWLRIYTLGEVETDTEQEAFSALVALTVLAVPGAHCVAMFAARPSWRRRGLYVTRVPWSAVAGVVLFVVLLFGPAFFLAAVVEVAEEFVSVGGDSTDAGDDAAGEHVGYRLVDEDKVTPAELVGETAQRDKEAGLEDYALLAGPLVAAALLVVIVSVMRSHGANAWRGFGFGGGRFWRHVGIGVAAYLAFRWAIAPVLGTFFELVLPLFNIPVEGHEAVLEFQETSSPVVRAGLMVAIAVEAPFFEEVVFRGVLFQTLRRYAGSAAGIVVSAAIFAAFHGTVYVILNIFFLGLLFGYLFDRTGSIVPGIVLHFLFNATTAAVLLAS